MHGCCVSDGVWCNSFGCNGWALVFSCGGVFSDKDNHNLPVPICFEINPQMAEIFNRDLAPQRIVRDLALLTGEDIIPGKTLLFFDEIC